jgi:glycerol-3-phosphate dehydrogenase
LQLIPTIETEGLKGGVIYHDGQFDDARLLINMVQTAVEQGAIMTNYMKVVSLLRDSNHINGIVIQDTESSIEYNINAKVIINATGVFSDSIRKMDDPKAIDIMTSSQGVHLVLDKTFLPGNSAIMVPHTDDGRVLFAVPWLNQTLVGTTDTFVNEYLLEPLPQKNEIDFLLKHAAKYLTKDPTREDVKSVFVGLRPLIKGTNAEVDTSSISRDHTITISRNGLISIAGGKWTTYRKMAEDVIEQAIDLGDLPDSESISKTLQIHGYHHNSQKFSSLSRYGSDATKINDLLNENKDYKKLLHPKYTIILGEVIWAVRNEMARNVEDFLSRRTRLLLLDAKASIEVAPKVAKLIAKELGYNKNWEISQVEQYNTLANNYLLI